MPERPEVRFEAVDIYYNYVFDLGCPVNPIDAARRLLNTPIGRAFCNPITGDLESGARYDPILSGFHNLSTLQQDMARFIERPNALVSEEAPFAEE